MVSEAGLEGIATPMVALKLIRSYGLATEQRQILGLLLVKGEWRLEECLRIKRSLEVVLQIYGYEQVDTVNN